MAEQRTLNARVGGSSPLVGTHFILLCTGYHLGNLYPKGTRLPVMLGTRFYHVHRALVFLSDIVSKSRTPQLLPRGLRNGWRQEAIPPPAWKDGDLLARFL